MYILASNRKLRKVSFAASIIDVFVKIFFAGLKVVSLVVYLVFRTIRIFCRSKTIGGNETMSRESNIIHELVDTFVREAWNVGRSVRLFSAKKAMMALQTELKGPRSMWAKHFMLKSTSEMIFPNFVLQLGTWQGGILTKS